MLKQFEKKMKTKIFEIPFVLSCISLFSFIHSFFFFLDFKRTGRNYFAFNNNKIIESTFILMCIFAFAV